MKYYTQAGLKITEVSAREYIEMIGKIKALCGCVCILTDEKTYAVIQNPAEIVTK